MKSHYCDKQINQPTQLMIWLMNKSEITHKQINPNGKSRVYFCKTAASSYEHDTPPRLSKISKKNWRAMKGEAIFDSPWKYTYLCQKHLFLDRLTHNMTKDCSLIYQFSRWKMPAQNMFFCFDNQNNLCKQHVLIL